MITIDEFAAVKRLLRAWRGWRTAHRREQFADQCGYSKELWEALNEFDAQLAHVETEPSPDYHTMRRVQ